MKRSWRSMGVGLAIVGLPIGWYVYDDVHDVSVAGTWAVASAPGEQDVSASQVTRLWVRFPSDEGGTYVGFDGCDRSVAPYSAGFGDHFTAELSNEGGVGCQYGDFEWDSALTDAQHVARDGDHLVIEDSEDHPLLELVPRAVGG